MIELLHFLLGGRADSGSLPCRKPLREARFTLKIEWPRPNVELTISRSGAKPADIFLAPDIVSANNASEELLFSDLFEESSIRVSLQQWQALIERDLFNLPSERIGISGRTLLSFYVRRIGDHAFNEPARTFPQQSLAEGTTNLAYLLGLDWGLASRYREISAKESMRRKLREAATDPVFGRIVGRSSELRGQIDVLEQSVRQLKGQIDRFIIVPGFEELQSKADELGQRIASSRILDAADRRNVQEIEAALAATVEPDPEYLAAAYEELGELVGDRIRRRLDEVTEFHSSVILNRRRYLQQEMDEARQKLDGRRRERESWGLEQARLLRSLQQGGALDSLMLLQEQYARAAAELQALRSRFEAADALESSRVQIAQERGRLQQDLNNDLRDRSEIVSAANLLFSSYASHLYGTKFPHILEFSADPSNLRITPRIESDEGRGVGNMAIFCFDLTVAVIAHRSGRGPDFLVHDSHLFDGVDERQVARALQLARRVSLAEGMQYVATMNSDDLNKARASGPADLGRIFDDSVIEPRLTDAAADGGLFGFRF